jgi:hypothetical protein
MQKRPAVFDEKMLNKTVKEASAAAKEAGFKFRVKKENGTGRIGTCDFWTDRINAATEEGIVTEFLGLG